MTSREAANGRLTPLPDMLAYAAGDGATSLVLNSMGFLMLYYTEALGVDYRLAGLAISAGTFWNAVTEPAMGQISDSTRCRFGRRHPYMLAGGILMALCFGGIWAIPPIFRTPGLILGYIIVTNLLLRSAITIFAVPHAALGFELCTDYVQRTTLQGIRVAFNMFVNLTGPALAWVLFFRSHDGTESTAVGENYMHMGLTFTVAATALVILVVAATRHYAADSRAAGGMDRLHPLAIVRVTTQVIMDRCPRPVFLFGTFAFIGMSLVASLEMYVYIHVMAFSSAERSIVHGSGVLACALGGLASPLLVRRIDKKASIVAAVAVLAAANIAMAILFVPARSSPANGLGVTDLIATVERHTTPAVLMGFVLLHALYWAGNGVLTPIAGSMIADASELNRYRTGHLRDGSYSSVFSCITKVSISVGILLAGFCLDGAGLRTGDEVQKPEAIRILALATFVGGAALAVVALVPLTRYGVTRADIEQSRTTGQQTASLPS